MVQQNIGTTDESSGIVAQQEKRIRRKRTRNKRQNIKIIIVK